MRYLYSIPIIWLVFLLTGCYKDDYEVVFDKVQSEVELENSINMGTEYQNQIFYDLEDKERYTSALIDWDIAFSASAAVPHIRINTGNGWSAHICSTSDMFGYPPISGIYPDQWLVDDPDGDPSRLALGDFLDLNSVYDKVVILRKDNFNGKFSYYLLKVSHIEPNKYQFEFSEKDASFITEYTANIPSALPHNYYYAKINGRQIDTLNQKIEATKEMGWDFYFTRYSRYFDDIGINYIVTGVLLNPQTTRAYLDSVSKFEDISMDDVDHSRLVKTMDVIGYNWKSIDNSYSDYTVKSNYNYIISTQEGNFYKLRFVGFYNQNHEKGNPSFEFQKLN